MTSNKSAIIGQMRYKADVQQYGGLCLFFSTLIAIFSLTDIATLCGGGKGNTPSSKLPLFQLISSILLCLVGIVGMAQGYRIFILNSPVGRFSVVYVVVTQLAWLPFLGSLTSTGRATTRPFNTDSPSFIPSILNPSEKDIRFVGAMGLISIMAYYAAFIGSLALTQFAIDAYGRGKASSRCAGFFRRRSLYYNILVILAGISQLLLGSYLAHRFGRGPYLQPVVTPIYTVFLPELNIVVGVVQIIIGSLGVARRFHYPADSTSEESVLRFQFMCGFMWFTMLILQNLVQNAYGVGSVMLIAQAPTLGLMYLPLAVMPALADYKMHTLPEEITPEYYGEDTAKVADDENKMEATSNMEAP